MKTIAVLTVTLCFAASAQASIIVSRSVEWLCDESDAVGIYKVVDNSVSTTNEHGRQRYAYTLQLSESLKGSPTKKCDAKFSTHVTTARKTGDTVREKDELLVCFQTKKSYAPAIMHQINLSRPWHAGSAFLAIDARFNVILNRKQIMTLVRSRLKRSPSKAVSETESSETGSLVEIPPGSQAWKALWAGSACGLLVPQDLKPEAVKEEKQPTKPSRVTPESAPSAAPRTSHDKRVQEKT